jgi:signal recognition particle subunit SEC65
MGARNHKDWLAEPTVEHISSECYSSHEIYKQEIEKIFSKVWIPIIHKSEIKNPGDYRTSQIAFRNIVIILILDSKEWLVQLIQTIKLNLENYYPK